MKNKRLWIKIILSLLIFGTVAYITHSYYDISPQAIREFILSFGWWGPVVFFFIYTIGPLVFLPTSVLSLGAGLAFGVWPGVLYIMLGASGAAVTGYIMARFFGSSVIKIDQYAWSEKVFKQMDKRGFMYVFVLRLIPVVSFDLLSFLAGFAKVKFNYYMIATVIGIIPGVFAYGFLGASIASGEAVMIFAAIGVFIVLLGITYYFRSHVKRYLGLADE
ncbi:TVP38/TMEM64 family protein [Alkalicoccus halolimnae]|uniref:TVP38/TMEM64 family membrane protein n=1 Tax=Alkalicoccus halolimnae TaxID=1667239 RepID=A0A5C7FN19_9BACI|nr:TVP38/TMEM64 family protein [Alkalicoccus halolimnae]TXF86165.1 TVP38/TMEM64 family protein [Alkalicoccus halolimnae]